MAIDNCNGLHQDYYIRHNYCIEYNSFTKLSADLSSRCKSTVSMPKHCNSTSKYSHFFVMFTQYMYQLTAGVTEWSRSLDIRLNEWCCSWAMARVQSRRESTYNLAAPKSNSNTAGLNCQTLCFILWLS